MFVLLLCLASTAYFTHHVFHGRYGLAARARIVEQTSAAEFAMASLEAVRVKLSRDVALLSEVPPHPDLVEDVARNVLGFVHPQDRLLPPS